MTASKSRTSRAVMRTTGNVGPSRVGLLRLPKFPPIHDWHDVVEEDHARLRLMQVVECLATVARRHDGMTLQAQKSCEGLPRRHVVINQKDRTRHRNHYL